jgi:hypothetical protein
MSGPRKTDDATESEQTEKAARTRGRPKSPDADRKSDVLRIRLTSAQRSAFETAAVLAKRDVSTWLREVGEREAARVQKAQAKDDALPPTDAKGAPTGGDTVERVMR